jgi:dephospho-CoA kinase
MRLVGLTGGIASGKSTFAAALRELGVPVIDADQLARAAVAKGTAGLARIAQAFGAEMIGPDGELDRRRMGAHVFSDPAARARLEAVVHPAVRELFQRELARLRAEGHPVVVYDVPLLFEKGLDPRIDLSVVVWAPREVQLTRLVARDQLPLAEAEARLAAQMPLDSKAALADAVVANEGPRAALAEKAARLLADVRAGLPRRLPNAAPARY